MAKNNNLAGLAVAGGIAAVGALFNRKKRKDAKKAAAEADKKAQEEMDIIMSEDPLSDTYESEPEPSEEKKCPNCGNIDANGAAVCPVCFTSMDGSQDENYDVI